MSKRKTDEISKFKVISIVNPFFLFVSTSKKDNHSTERRLLLQMSFLLPFDGEKFYGFS